MTRSRNWIKSDVGFYVNSSLITCIYVHKDIHGEWLVRAENSGENGARDTWLLRKCPDEESARREMENIIDCVQRR